MAFEDKLKNLLCEIELIFCFLFYSVQHTLFCTGEVV